MTPTAAHIARAVVFIVGWFFGFIGICLLLTPVYWLFGKVQITGMRAAMLFGMGAAFFAVGASAGYIYEKMRPKV